MLASWHSLRFEKQMLTEAEKQAYDLAERLVDQAADEAWRYLNLSPKSFGVAEPREGFEVLEHLSLIPPNIRHLAAGTHIELRGTQIRDLRPLAHVTKIGWIEFRGIPAEENDQELEQIAEKSDADERLQSLLEWLERSKIDEPPEQIAGGPEFLVDDEGPVRLLDPLLETSDDQDQEDLRKECERKSAELAAVVQLAANVAPDLPAMVHRYSELIARSSQEIGTRAIWSLANSLEAQLEIHEVATTNDRQAEELPVVIASKLKDLTQTHRVWFLGHPGARQVEERAAKHQKPDSQKHKRKALISIVEAAVASSAVSPDATFPARHNVTSSMNDTPAGIAAFGELEEWVWNFVASITRKAWIIVKDPPGGFLSQTIAGHYLLIFIIQNEAVIQQYVQTCMSQAPLWWDTLSAALRRFSTTPRQDKT